MDGFLAWHGEEQEDNLGKVTVVLIVRWTETWTRKMERQNQRGALHMKRSRVG